MRVTHTRMVQVYIKVVCNAHGFSLCFLHSHFETNLTDALIHTFLPICPDSQARVKRTLLEDQQFLVTKPNPSPTHRGGPQGLDLEKDGFIGEVTHSKTTVFCFCGIPRLAGIRLGAHEVDGTRSSRLFLAKPDCRAETLEDVATDLRRGSSPHTRARLQAASKRWSVAVRRSSPGPLLSGALDAQLSSDCSWLSLISREADQRTRCSEGGMKHALPAHGPTQDDGKRSSTLPRCTRIQTKRMICSTKRTR